MIPGREIEDASRKSWITVQQIAYALQRQELGRSIDEICRKMGLAKSTFNVWKRRYAAI